jgi:biopolymer transport protein ExbB/biopolymer transport protein TolQ
MLVLQLTKVALLGASWVLYLLIGLSVVSLAAVAERLLFFRRNARGGGHLRDALVPALQRNDSAAAERALEANPSVEARVLKAALAWRAGGPDAVRDAIDSELEKARPSLLRGTNLLGTIGSNAPFIGLFGTVIGVIEAFHHLGSSGQAAGDAAMGNVMSGIAEALVATGVGLFVAIPAVVSYNVLQERIDQIENNTIALGKLVTAWLHTYPAQQSTPHESARPALSVAGNE